MNKRRFTARQMEVINEFEARSGFEVMRKDAYRSRAITFAEMWDGNIKWLQDWVGEITSIKVDDITLAEEDNLDRPA